MGDGGRDEGGDVPAVAGDVLDEGGGDVRVYGRSRQEDRLGRPQVAVEQCHGQFSVQVTAVAQALDDGVRAAPAAVVGQEPGNDVHLDAGQVGGGLLGQAEAFVDVEQVAPGLGGVVGDPDDDDVEERGRAGGDVDVPQGEGIEASGVDGQAHTVTLLAGPAAVRDARRTTLACTPTRRPGFLGRRCYILLVSTRVTLSDVAEAVGVSAQTVSRVLNNHPSVRPETRQKVLAAVQALGYEPNLAARSLASGSSGAVGILLTAGLSHGMASIFSAIARAVRERGDTFVLATADGHAPESVKEALAHLHGHRVTTVVVLAQRADVLAVLSSQRDRGPVVAIISGQHEFSELSTVSIDQALGARLATEHLLAQGRSRLLHVTGDLSWQDASERLAAYESVCAQAGVPGRWVGTDAWTGEAGAKVARRLLDSGLPDAVFAANDDIALGLCHELLAAGVRIPDDVAVVGFDDIPLARWATPSLSSVIQDFDALGQASLRLSDELVEGAPAHSICLKPQLVVRASTTKA